jgi:hypothetical protein
MLQPYRRWCLVFVQLQPAHRISLVFLRMHGRQNAKSDFRIITISIIVVVIVMTVDLFNRLAT